MRAVKILGSTRMEYADESDAEFEDSMLVAAPRDWIALLTLAVMLKRGLPLTADASTREIADLAWAIADAVVTIPPPRSGPSLGEQVASMAGARRR